MPHGCMSPCTSQVAVLELALNNGQNIMSKWSWIQTYDNHHENCWVMSKKCILWCHSGRELWPQNSNQSIFKYKWVFAQNQKKLPQDALEITRSQAWGGWMYISVVAIATWWHGWQSQKTTLPGANNLIFSKYHWYSLGEHILNWQCSTFAQTPAFTLLTEVFFCCDLGFFFCKLINTFNPILRSRSNLLTT